MKNFGGVQLKKDMINRSGAQNNGEKKKISKVKIVSVKDAIGKNDLVRIRSGSPGSRNNPIIKKDFENEMKQNGIAGDV